MGLKAPWDPSRLTQKSDWPTLFQSLSFTNKQPRVLIAILSFVREKEQHIDYYPLTRHGSSSRFWGNRFVSTYERSRSAAAFTTVLKVGGHCEHPAFLQ